MKNNKTSLPDPNANKNNREIKNKKRKTTAADIDNIITGAVENVKAASGNGLANEGPSVSYNEES
jgi:hypothetical protein